MADAATLDTTISQPAGKMASRGPDTTARRKTYTAKPGEIDRKWLVVDLDKKILGRAATQIAVFLRGKHKPQFTPHVDTGDFVVVINAEKVQLTGKKLDDKQYHRHTGFPGGLRTLTAKQMFEKKPEEVIRKAVKGMLPKNSLGRSLLLKLKVYTGAEHPHEAQSPVLTELR